MPTKKPHIIIRPYYYLFYKIHVFTKKLGDWYVEDSSLAGLCMLQALQISVIYIDLIGKENMNKDKDFYIIGLITIFLMILNYFLFLHKKKYKEIEKWFKNESNTQRIIGNIIVSVYVIFSLTWVFWAD